MKKIYLLVLLLMGLLMVSITIATAQNSTLQGKVITSDGQPAAYVNVLVKGQSKVITTAEDGLFEIKNLAPGDYTIVVSHTGLQTAEKAVTVPADKNSILNIVLAESTSQLEEVIVRRIRTINRKPVAIGKVAVAPMDLPQSITIINQQTIANQQALRLNDVIKNVNGVYLSSARGSTQETFSGRGYSLGSNNLFKNGFRVNSGSMPEVSGLESVEVLKGSAAILYGNVAPGAVVNMVTKQPKFEKGGQISFQTGSFDLYKPMFDVYGPVSKTIAYRINGSFEKANSYRDVVNSTRYYVNPSLLFNIGKKTTLLLQGDYLKHQFTPDFGIGTINNTTIPDVPRSRFMGTPWQYALTKQYTGTAFINHELGTNWKLGAGVSYQQYERDNYSTERIQALANGNWGRPLGRTNTQEKYYTAQANLTGKLKTGALQHTILAGIDADHYLNTNYTFNNPATYDTINILNPNKYTPRTDIPVANRIRVVDVPANRFGVYLQDLIKINSRFNLMAGLRWSYLKTYGADSTNLLTGAQSKGVAREDKAFSPRVGLVYKPTGNTSVFASYSNSFVVNSGTDIYGQNLKPSLIDQFEAGIKNELFNGRLSANITAYRIKNNNLAQTALQLADGSSNTNTNIKTLTGETTSDGIEIDLAGHPLKGLDVLAGYSYNFIRYTKTDTTKSSFKTGERLIGNPSHTYNATAFYTFNALGVKGFRVGASVFYLGERYAGFNNTVGQAQNYNRLFKVAGYTTADISLGYTAQHVSVMARISNISNTLNYTVHENYSVNPIAPRMFSTTVAYKL